MRRPSLSTDSTSAKGAATNERATATSLSHLCTTLSPSRTEEVSAPLETARQPCGIRNVIEPGAAGDAVPCSMVAGMGYQFSTQEANATLWLITSWLDSISLSSE